MLLGTSHQSAESAFADVAALKENAIAEAKGAPALTETYASKACAGLLRSQIHTDRDVRPKDTPYPTDAPGVILSLPGQRARRFGAPAGNHQKTRTLPAAQYLQFRLGVETGSAAVVQPDKQIIKRLCTEETRALLLSRPPKDKSPGCKAAPAVACQNTAPPPWRTDAHLAYATFTRRNTQPPSVSVSAVSAQPLQHPSSSKEASAPEKEDQPVEQTPAGMYCPTCGDFLEDVAETQTGQRAHVKYCSDANDSDENYSEVEEDQDCPGAADEDIFHDCINPGGELDCMDQQLGSDAPSLSDELKEGFQDCTEPSATAAAAVKQPQEVAKLLEEIGCGQYASVFMQAELTVPSLSLLIDEDLQQLGVSAMGPRRRILAAAQQANNQAIAAPSVSNGVQAGLSASGSKEQRQAASLKTSCITDYFAGRPSSKPVQPAPKPAVLVAARTHWKKDSGWKRHYNPGAKVTVPEWHKVPGTSFIVDKFGRQIEDSVTCKSWFLTHFHADHYMGLNGRFKSGLVYCTGITARLVNARLNVSMNRIRILQLNEAVTVEGVKVTFLDANHCPGAAMILFEVPGQQPVLHCGDCRCHEGMQNEPLLQNLRQGRLDLYLDTTYCSPQYDFPSQQEVLRFVVEAFKAEKYNQNKTLFLFGSYTIGKERLFLEAARILQQKIYVSRAKRKVLEALDLPREYRMLLTENDREATIQAVPMGMVNMKRMANIAKHYRSRFTTIVGIQPTGWTHTSERSKASRGRRLQKGSLILYKVAYSEHSSFRELHEFVRWLQPNQIVPTVGNDRGSKARTMIQLLRNALPAAQQSAALA